MIVRTEILYVVRVPVDVLSDMWGRIVKTHEDTLVHETAEILDDGDYLGETSGQRFHRSGLMATGEAVRAVVLVRAKNLAASHAADIPGLAAAGKREAKR